MPPPGYDNPACVFDSIPVDCSMVDGSVTNDDTHLSVTLSGLIAERSGEDVNIDWQTATESGTAGFNILIPDGNQLVQINASLIPSPVIDSVTPTDYHFSMATQETTFYLQEVHIDDRTTENGPFELGIGYGIFAPQEIAPAIWLPFLVK